MGRSHPARQARVIVGAAGSAGFLVMVGTISQASTQVLAADLSTALQIPAAPTGLDLQGTAVPGPAEGTDTTQAMTEAEESPASTVAAEEPSTTTTVAEESTTTTTVAESTAPGSSEEPPTTVTTAPPETAATTTTTEPPQTDTTSSGS